MAVQELNAAADNAQPEGFTAVMQAVTKPVRLNNVCQILARTVGVSNTLRVVDVAGGEDEYNRQLVLRGMEVKRDLELAVTSPLVRTITDPRHMSGLPCYTRERQPRRWRRRHAGRRRQQRGHRRHAA